MILNDTIFFFYKIDHGLENPNHEMVVGFLFFSFYS
jgi:hypothetical protein